MLIRYLVLSSIVLFGVWKHLSGQDISVSGERADESQQFELPQPPFLFGLRTNLYLLGGRSSLKFFMIFSHVQIPVFETSKQQEDLSFVDEN